MTNDFIDTIAPDTSRRCLVFRDGTKISYPTNMPIYKLGVQLTVNDSGYLCPGMIGEPFVCTVGRTK